MSINITLFKLLKNHEWDKFKELIDKTTELDLNIRDNSNNYLLQYVILYNKPDLVDLLLNKDARIDINDSDFTRLLNYFINSLDS